MPDRDTDWKPGDQAVVTISTPGDVWTTIRGTNDCDYAFLTKALRPLPTPSPTEQRVVEAAVVRLRAARGSKNLMGEPLESAERELEAATDAHLASLRPADPLAVALGALRSMLDNFGNPHRSEWLNDTAWHEARAACARAAIPLIEVAMKGEG